MGPVATTGYLLQHTASILMRQSDQVLQERLGMGMSQLRIMMMLSRNPGEQQRKLADSLGQTEASISRQIKLLQEKSFLTVRVNPKNRREHITVPTAKGLKITQAALDVLEQYHAPMFNQLSDKQRKQLNEMLGVLHNNCCSPGKQFACDHPLGL